MQLYQQEMPLLIKLPMPETEYRKSMPVPHKEQVHM